MRIPGCSWSFHANWFCKQPRFQRPLYFFWVLSSSCFTDLLVCCMETEVNVNPDWWTRWAWLHECQRLMNCKWQNNNNCNGFWKMHQINNPIAHRLCLRCETVTRSLAFPPPQNSLFRVFFPTIFWEKADGQEEHRLSVPTPADKEYGTVAFDK